MAKISLAKPYIPKSTIPELKKVLESGMLSEGVKTEEFERLVEDYTGAKHAIACTSCTTGLEMALRCAGVRRGDEVIVPDFTYPATSEAVMSIGAEPVLVDVERQTCVMSALYHDEIVMPVSQFGCPTYPLIGKFVIEDAACSIGSTYKGIQTGRKANITVFSFHPRKTITTGEGGMITTDDDELADRLMSYKQFGLKNGVFVEPGTNLKMSDILATVGVEQMKVIDKIMDRRRKLAKNYADLINDTGRYQHTIKDGTHSYQSFCVFVGDNKMVRRRLLEKNIETQVGSYALHMQPAFKNCKHDGTLENSTWLDGHALVLPMYHTLTDDKQVEVVEALKRVW